MRPRADSSGSLAALLLVAVNLRISITAVSPVLDQLRADLDLSRGVAGLLTTLPVVCFGVLAPVAAYLGRRLGNELALTASLVCLVVGIVVRSSGGPAYVLLGTLLLGTGIAVGNILVPALVKRDLSFMAGTAMALYTTCLTGGAALAAAGTAALAAAGWGWRPALAAGAAPALVATVVFGLWAHRRHSRGNGPPAVTLRGAGRVWRSATAWQLAVFMGGQSLLFYSVLAWLPALLQDRGVSLAVSGGMLSLYNLLGIAGALVLPPLAARRPDQRVPAFLTAAGWVIGLGGLWLVPGWYVGWTVLLGLTQGAGIAMALTLIVLRARDSDVARELSGMVQMTGYLLAASGPLVVGALRDRSGDWAWSLAALLAVAGAMLVAADGAGRHRVVG